MITSETPYKLAEILRDTWPNLFYTVEEKTKKEEDKEDPS